MELKPPRMSSINSWLEDELYQQYLHDHGAVDESWQTVFSHHAAPANGSAPKPAPAIELGSNEQLVPLRGAAARIAQNMEASLSMPLATSQRTIPVKVIDENRRIINQHRTLVGKSKVSYTHLIGWAIVKALKSNPGLNHAYIERGDEPFRLVRPQVNLGIAVDVEGKDGARNLVVANIKNAGEIDFQQYVSAFDDLVSRARKGKLTPGGFSGHHHLADQPRHGRDHGLDSAPDAGPGRHHRHRRDRLSRRSIRAWRRRCAPRSASAR